ncbi:MAG: 50S ribosomal protein L9 [Treponema sp.]|jgi:large subunit ribosomal protein L9|nr:50S ribosomal protein L9 [Treponema sp.]
MKVILNKDLATLGEEGDVKDVAKGYARNYLFPRGIALPYTESTIKLFESRREEIEARKADKRKDALGLREKLEALELVIAMPAGANGKLYGAVTAQTIADELDKQGFKIERKRIELAGNSFKNVGKYKVTVKLYESASAELSLTVEGQAVKTETRTTPSRTNRRRRDNETATTTETAVKPVVEPAAEIPAEAAPQSLPERAQEGETPAPETATAGE